MLLVGSLVSIDDRDTYSLPPVIPLCMGNQG